MSPKDADGMANSVDPDQTAPEQSDLDLHSLPRPISPKTKDHYGMAFTYRSFTVIVIPYWSLLSEQVWANSVDQDQDSVDLDQTVPVGTVLSGATFFAQTCLSEYCT